MGTFKEGDVVRIIDDMAEVHMLQDDHGGWVDDMALVRINCFVLYECVCMYVLRL